MQNLISLPMRDRRIAELLYMGTKLKAGSDVISADLGGEISLLNNKSGVYYTLNAVGAHVWRQTSQVTTLAEIKKKLLEDYNVDEARCELDLIRIVGELHAHGLIEVCPSLCS
jgi:regulatory protein YycI of two-component signal transduction system YycFG